MAKRASASHSRLRSRRAELPKHVGAQGTCQIRSNTLSANLSASSVNPGLDHPPGALTVAVQVNHRWALWVPRKASILGHVRMCSIFE